jgi:thiol-disulfide isomerase/thioredoxin
MSRASIVEAFFDPLYAKKKKRGRVITSLRKEHSVPKTNRWVLILLMVLGGVAITVFTSGCYLFFQRIQQAGSSPAGGPVSGTQAPDFALTDLGGITFRLSDFKGKVVVLDFMATWCGPCKQQIPHLRTIWEKYRDRVVIISIDVDLSEPEDVLRSYRHNYPYATWIWAKDIAEQRVAVVYGVRAIPTIVVIDQESYIRFVHVGLTDSSTLAREIDELLGRAW